MKKLLLCLPLLATIGVAVPAQSKEASCSQGGNAIQLKEKADFLDVSIDIQRAADSEACTMRDMGFRGVAAKIDKIANAAVDLKERLQNGELRHCDDVEDVAIDLRELLLDAVDQAIDDGVPKSDIDGFDHAISTTLEDLGTVALAQGVQQK